MKTIILSLRPTVFPALLSGLKHFEYRHTFPADVSQVYLYLSSPMKAVVGELTVGKRISLNQLLVETTDEKTKSRLQILTEEGARWAMPIKQLSLFQQPISLTTARNFNEGFVAPQSYCYLERYPQLAEQLVQSRRQKKITWPLASMEYLLGYSCQEIYRLPTFKNLTGEYLGQKIKV